MAHKMNTNQMKSQMQSASQQSMNSATSKTGYKEKELTPSRKNLKK